MTNSPDKTLLVRRLEQIGSQLFFIVGCGRSGTTLLQAMLLCNEDIVIPPETKFFTGLAGPDWQAGQTIGERQYHRIAMRVWRDQRRRRVETDRDRFLALAQAAPRTWEGLFTALLAAYADGQGASRVGEKSPVHTHVVGELMVAYPRAKFVHIVRDPRAVIMSRMVADFGTHMIGPNIQRWRRAIEMHRDYADRLGPDRYYMLRYEDLVTDPEQPLRAVCDHLGIPFVPDMLQPHKRRRSGVTDPSSSVMANTFKPISTSSIDRWRRDMKPAHVAMTEYALRDEMSLMNYPTTGARTWYPSIRIAMSMPVGKVEMWWRTIRRALRKIRTVVSRKNHG